CGEYRCQNRSSGGCSCCCCSCCSAAGGDEGGLLLACCDMMVLPRCDSRWETPETSPSTISPGCGRRQGKKFPPGHKSVRACASTRPMPASVAQLYAFGPMNARSRPMAKTICTRPTTETDRRQEEEKDRAAKEGFSERRVAADRRMQQPTTF